MIIFQIYSFVFHFVTLFSHSQKKWSCGRVARQSSAKASTAVRIRSGPQKKELKISIPFFMYLFGECHIGKCISHNIIFTAFTSITVIFWLNE